MTLNFSANKQMHLTGYQCSRYCVIKLLPFVKWAIIKPMETSKRTPAASVNVVESESIFKSGEMIIGDKNCPRNQNVVSFPISLPLISGGASFITHIFVLGIIIPMPRPDN